MLECEFIYYITNKSPNRYWHHMIYIVPISNQIEFLRHSKNIDQINNVITNPNGEVLQYYKVKLLSKVVFNF